jgi:hypothetical protein
MTSSCPIRSRAVKTSDLKNGVKLKQSSKDKYKEWRHWVVQSLAEDLRQKSYILMVLLDTRELRVPTWVSRHSCKYLFLKTHSNSTISLALGGRMRALVVVSLIVDFWFLFCFRSDRNVVRATSAQWMNWTFSCPMSQTQPLEGDSSKKYPATS